MKTRIRRKNRHQYDSLERRQMLATLTVTTFADGTEIDDELTLREAISIANSNNEDDVIVLDSGTYDLKIIELDEDNNRGGDLDIKPDGGHSLTITGAGSDTPATTISANGIDRVIHVHPTSQLTLENVVITQGSLNAYPLAVGKRGAGIYSVHSQLDIRNSLIQENGDGAYNNTAGGGLYVAGGTVDIFNSKFTANEAYTNGHAIFIRGTTANFELLEIKDSCVGDQICGFPDFEIIPKTVLSRDSMLFMSRTLFDENRGGLHIVGGSAELDHTRFFNNYGPEFFSSPRVHDAAINGEDTDIKVHDSRVVFNDNGIIVTGDSNLEVTDSNIRHNRNHSIEFSGRKLVVKDSNFFRNWERVIHNESGFDDAETIFENVNFQGQSRGYLATFHTGVVTILGVTNAEVEEIPEDILIPIRAPGIQAIGESVLIQGTHITDYQHERALIATEAVISRSTFIRTGGLQVTGRVDIHNVVIRGGFFKSVGAAGPVGRGTGGGIYWNPGISGTTSGSMLEISNSEIIKQRAAFGGAIFIANSGTISESQVLIRSSSILGNRSEFSGVIQSSNESNVAFDISNSIFWNNFSPPAEEGDLFAGSQTYNVVNSIFFDEDPDDDAVRFDAAAGNLDDNPRFIDYAAGDYRLNSNSPAIDAGVSSDLLLDIYDADQNGVTDENAPDVNLLNRVVGDETDIGARDFFSLGPGMGT